MSASTQRRDHPLQPEPLEEAYWEALLHDGDVGYTPEELKVDFGYGGNGSDEFDQHNSLGAADLPISDDWQAIRQIMDADDVIELQVIGYNRGGLLVEWRSLRGFVPASQLIAFNTNAAVSSRRNALNDRIGQVLVLRVIELNEAQNRLILSERAARVLPGERADLLARLQVGDRISGTVTNLCDFGVFVDLGGLEGLIHISELSWGRVAHPADVLKRGQAVEVYVLDVHPDSAQPETLASRSMAGCACALPSG
jgi:ribosomal protein S1